MLSNCTAALISRALSNLIASDEFVVTNVIYALLASSNTREAPSSSLIFTELATLNVNAPSAPADNVKSPAISAAPDISKEPAIKPSTCKSSWLDPNFNSNLGPVVL